MSSQHKLGQATSCRLSFYQSSQTESLRVSLWMVVILALEHSWEEPCVSSKMTAIIKMFHKKACSCKHRWQSQWQRLAFHPWRWVVTKDYMDSSNMQVRQPTTLQIIIIETYCYRYTRVSPIMCHRWTKYQMQWLGIPRGLCPLNLPKARGCSDPSSIPICHYKLYNWEKKTFQQNVSFHAKLEKSVIRLH